MHGMHFKEHFDWILWISLIDFERNFADFRSDLGDFQRSCDDFKYSICEDFGHRDLNVNPTLDLIYQFQ